MYAFDLRVHMECVCVSQHHPNTCPGRMYMNKERTNAYKQSVHIARDRYCLHFVFASSRSHATATGARAKRNRQVVTDSR